MMNDEVWRRKAEGFCRLTRWMDICDCRVTFESEKCKADTINQMQMHPPTPQILKAGEMMVLIFFPITNKLKNVYSTLWMTGQTTFIFVPKCYEAATIGFHQWLQFSIEVKHHFLSSEWILFLQGLSYQLWKSNCL